MGAGHSDLRAPDPVTHFSQEASSRTGSEKKASQPIAVDEVLTSPAREMQLRLGCSMQLLSKAQCSTAHQFRTGSEEYHIPLKLGQEAGENVRQAVGQATKPEASSPVKSILHALLLFVFL